MNVQKRVSLSGEEGFTLSELLIAFIILAMIVYAAFNIMDVNIRAGTVYNLRSEVSQKLREATAVMVDQLRTANSFTSAEASSLTFTSYLTGTSSLYYVQYLLQDNALIQRVSLTTPTDADNKVISENVTGLQFRYFDTASSLIENPSSDSARAAIAMVEIVITMTVTSGNNQISDTYTTMARVRMRK